jgi:hypothetical protein
MNVQIGPWERIVRGTEFVLFWTYATYEAEGLPEEKIGKAAIAAYRTLLREYNLRDDDSIRSLLQQVGRVGSDQLLCCKTVWGDELHCPFGINVYRQFLKRITLSGAADKLNEFVDRIDHPLPIDEEVLQELQPYLDEVEIPLYEIDWKSATLGPGSIAEKNPRKPWKLCSPLEKVYYGSWKDLRRRESRVSSVPKDWKGDRVISAQPMIHELNQSCVASALIRSIERHTPITFRSQEANRQAVSEVEATYEYAWATLDQSNASDRVQLRHVQAVLPNWYSLLCSVRTPKALLPDGRKIAIAPMFETMGSKLTFPVETVVFWKLAYAILRKLGFSRYDAYRCVIAFGDDLLVPDYVAPFVISYLEKLGFELNEEKSHYGSDDPYRESCGVEVIKPRHRTLPWDITPVRLPRGSMLSWFDDPGCTIDALVAFHNELVFRSLPTTAAILRMAVCGDLLSQFGKKYLPIKARPGDSNLKRLLSQAPHCGIHPSDMTQPLTFCTGGPLGSSHGRVIAEVLPDISLSVRERQWGATYSGGKWVAGKHITHAQCEGREAIPLERWDTFRTSYFRFFRPSRTPEELLRVQLQDVRNLQLNVQPYFKIRNDFLSRSLSEKPLDTFSCSRVTIHPRSFESRIRFACD